MFIITGGSRGIGAATAKCLANQNQKVLIIGRNQETLDEVANTSEHIQTLVADVATHEGQSRIIAYCLEQEVLTAFIHNAGIIEPIAPIKALPAADWQHILNTNLTAPFAITQALIKKLEGGRVLHIGSGAAYFPVEGWSAYCVSKAGILMLTKCLQLECPEIPTAFVRPGIIDTQMQVEIRDSDLQDPEKHDFFMMLKSENKLISPETVALFLSWLLLSVDKTRYVSREWDIYDTSHHEEWLAPPHVVPSLD